MYQNLVRTVEPDAPQSVHLCDYPSPAALTRDAALEAMMDSVREVVTLGRAARSAAKIRVRQPLPAVLIATPTRGLSEDPELIDLLVDELNVKEVRFVDDAAAYVTYEVKPRFDKLGPKYGGRVQAIAAALRALPAREVAMTLAASRAQPVMVGGDEVRVEPDELEIRIRTGAGYAAEGGAGHVVVLETSLDDALVREGQARELVHHVQQMRKDRGLDVSDRIILYLDGDGVLGGVLDAHRDYIMAETLASAVRAGAGGEPREVKVEGLVARIGLERA